MTSERINLRQGNHTLRVFHFAMGVSVTDATLEKVAEKVNNEVCPLIPSLTDLPELIVRESITDIVSIGPRVFGIADKSPHPGCPLHS